MQHFADMIGVVPHPQGAPDQIPYPARGPGVVWKAVREGTLPQEGPQLFVLFGKEAPGWSLGDCCLEGTVLFEAGFPAINRVDRDAEMIGNLFVRVRATLNPFQRGESTFFQLYAGEMSRKPTGHASILSRQSYAEINSIEKVASLQAKRRGYFIKYEWESR